MPIYEYKGQRYNIATTDPVEAKAKILKYLGESAPAPVKEPEPVVSREEALAKARLAAGQGYGSALTGSEPDKETASWTERLLQDPSVSLAKGVVGLGQAVTGLANIAAQGAMPVAARRVMPEGPITPALEKFGYRPKETQEALGQLFSEKRQKEEAQVQEAQGFVDTIKALYKNPAVAVGSGLESLPQMLAVSATARYAAIQMLNAAGVRLGTKEAAEYLARPEVAAKLATLAHGAEGALTAGSILEQGREEGRTLSQTMPAALAAGVGTAAIGKLASKILPEGDVEAALTKLRLGAVDKKELLEVGKSIAKGMFSEGVLEELPQSTQEQIFTNLALGEQWDKGVGQAAAMGLVTGAGMGGAGKGASALLERTAPSAPPPAQPATATPAPPAPPAITQGAAPPPAPAAPPAPKIRVTRTAAPQFSTEEQELIDAAVAAGVSEDEARSNVIAQRSAAPTPPAAPAQAPPAPAVALPEIKDTDSDELKQLKAKFIERQAQIEEEKAKKERGEKHAPLKIVNQQRANDKLAQQITQLEAAAPANAAILDQAQKLVEQANAPQTTAAQGVPDVTPSAAETDTGGAQQQQVAGTAKPLAGEGEPSNVVPVSEQAAEGQGAEPAVGGGVGSAAADVAGPDVGEAAGEAPLEGATSEKAPPKKAAKTAKLADFARPTEDQIYAADNDNLQRLLYEATVDANGDLRPGGIPEKESEQLGAKLRNIASLPKNDQLKLRIQIGDRIAQAHGLLDEQGEPVNPPEVTAMANEGVPPSVPAKRKRGRPKGSKNKPKTELKQQGVAEEVATPEKISQDAPKQTTEQLSPDQLQEALSGKSILFAVNHVATASNNPLYRLLAGRIKSIIEAMKKAGVVMAPIQYADIPGALGSIAVGRINPKLPLTASNLRIAITLRPGSGYSTLMHELLHAATVPLRTIADLQSIKGITSELAEIGRQYKNVARFVIKEFNRRAKNAVANRDTQVLELGDTNFPQNEDEVFAWALSSDAAWNFVNSLDYVNPITKVVRSVGDMFVIMLRRMLNLPVRYNSALAEVLAVTARMSSLDPQELADALGAQYEVGESKLRKIIGGPKPMAAPTPPTAPTPKKPGRRKASPTAGMTAEQLEQRKLEQAKLNTAEENSKKSVLTRVKNFFSNEGMEKFEEEQIDNRRAFEQLQRALDLTDTLVLENEVDASGNVVKGFNNIRDRIWSSSTILAEIYKSRLAGLFDDTNRALADIAKATGLKASEVSEMADYYRKMMHLPERRRTLFMMFSPLENKTRNLQVPKPDIPNLTADEKSFLGVDLDGSTQDMTAAGFREFAVKLVHLNRTGLDPYIEAYRDMLMDLTEAGNPNSALDKNGSSLADVMGSRHNIKPGGWSLDINSSLYNPLETYTADQENEALARFMDPAKTPHRDLYMKLFAILDKIQEQKKELDKEANFWSVPVDNIAKLYDWKNYVPLTGRPAAITKEEQRELDALEAKKAGGTALTAAEVKRYKDLLTKREKEPVGSLTNFTEYSANQRKGPLENVEITNVVGMGGRTSASDNIISAVLTGAVKAGMRVARRDTTQALVNLINTKSPTGRSFVDAKLVKTIPFHQRFTGLGDVLLDDKGNKLPSNQIFLHYTGDGTVQVYQFRQSAEGQRIANALRKDKEDRAYSALLDASSVIVGYYARSFTALSPTFLTKDFVRNTLSLTFTVTSEQGKRFMAKYAVQLAGKIASLGVGPAVRAAYLYETGNYDKLKQLAQDKPYRYKNIYEFLLLGKSDLTLLSEYTSMSQSQRILKRVASADKRYRNWMTGTGKAFQSIIEIYMRAFNLMFQAEAFGIVRDKAMRERNVSREAASLYAGQYIKDLGNFQKTGKLAENLGSLYAFVRSGSVGAIRFVNAVKPLLVQDVKNYMYGAPQALMEVSTTGVPVYDAQLAAAKKKYSKRKLDTAFVVLSTLSGLGILPFMFASGGDDDDEPTDAQGRNTVKTDDFVNWTREMRIPMCRIDASASCTQYLTIPYGYGFGGLFAGTGVQMAAWAKGYQSIGDATVNTALILSDNFLPIQPARFNPFKPVEGYDQGRVATFWMLDTVSPTPLKMPLEYVMGITGLGQKIGAGTSGKYGEAYVANETVSEAYNDAAKLFSDVTDGKVTMSPESLRRFSNMIVPITDEYVGKLYNLSLTAQGKLDFDPRNVPGLAGFVKERRSPVPGKYYDVLHDVQEKIADYNRDVARIGMGDKFAERRLDQFYDKHPELYGYEGGFEGFKKDWNKLNAQLNKVREATKDIKAGMYGDMSPKERKQLVKENDDMRDYIMEVMIDQYRLAFPKDAEKMFPEPKD